LFSFSKLAINEYFGVGYCVTFPRTNYGSENGLACNLTEKHLDMSLRFEEICPHPSIKTTFSPQISETRSFIHLPPFVIDK
jgi:hypothetical protein